MELQAAVHATDCVARYSPTFAVSVAGQLATLVRSLLTPPDIKLKAVAALRHFHRSPETARTALELGMQLLHEFSSQASVVVALKALAQIVVRSLVGVGPFMELLFARLETDPRHGVRAVALGALHRLALHIPHLVLFWTFNKLGEKRDLFIFTCSYLVGSGCRRMCRGC